MKPRVMQLIIHNTTWHIENFLYDVVFLVVYLICTVNEMRETFFFGLKTKKKKILNGFLKFMGNLNGVVISLIDVI